MESSISLDQPISQGRFGRLVGTSQQAVSKRVDDGLLREAAPLGEWLKSYCGKLREEASGRGDEDSKALTRAKTREAEAKAAMGELNYHRELRQLVPVDEVEPLLETWAVTARSEAQHAVEKTIAAIESKYGIEVERELYDEHLRAAFAVIASYPENLAGDDEPSGEQVDAAARDPHTAMDGGVF